MRDRPSPSRVARLATIVLGLALGLASERSATGFTHPATWIPDLAVGWTFVVAGVIARDRRPSSRSGILMVATGGAWFLPNFAVASPAALAWVAERTLYLYRGPLIHLLLTIPTGRATSRLTRVAAALGYGAALVTAVWRSDPGAIVLAAALVGVGAVDYRRAVGPSRRARLWALRADVVAALFIAGGAVARIVVPEGAAVDPSHLVFEVSLCVLAIGLLGALLVAPWERVAVTDLVVEMGEARSDGLRDRLARALGDPTLEVGYRVPGVEALVDARGQPFALPEPAADRAVTPVRHGEREVAVLVHDRSVLGDPGLLGAVSAAAQLAASNARLQAEVRASVAELAASRRRLLEAEDEERRRLERRLREGAERRLLDVAATVELARGAAVGSAAERFGEVEAEIRQTLEDLERLARGLHPRDLSELGFEGALQVLAARTPVAVSVRVDAEEPAPQTAGVAYYLCAEALTNVAKHARASSASVTISRADGHLVVVVSDDGIGGADGARGSGLRGLVDRIETLGGSLSIESPSGEGTRLAARIPLNPSRTA